MAHEAFDYGDFAIVNFTRELAAKDGLADELRLVVQAYNFARRVTEVFSFRDSHLQVQLAEVVCAMVNSLSVRGLRSGLEDVRLARGGHLPFKSHSTCEL